MPKNITSGKSNFGNDLLMKKTDLNVVEASGIAHKYGLMFVELLILLENYWFFMISFSYFIHNKFQIDDCAILSKVEHQEKAVTFIRRKINFGKDYFELTYKFGYIELLAASGFFGSVDDTSFFPFLRSSIQELPATITTRLEIISIKVVFITNVQKQYVRKNRIVNQYFRRMVYEGYARAIVTTFSTRAISHTAFDAISAKYVVSMELRNPQEQLLKGIRIDFANRKNVNII